MKQDKINGRDKSLRSKYLTDAQLQTLLQYVKSKAEYARRKGNTRSIIDELVILLLVNTGIQAGELCNLSISDLPMEHGENAIFVRDEKGDVVRAVEIESTMVEYLNRYVKLYRKAANRNEPLIINERGKRISYMSLYSKVRIIGEKAKIGKLHPNMLRCTFLVRLFDNKNDLRFVQEQAGHANRKTTALYAKMTNDLLRAQATSENSSLTVKATDALNAKPKPAECDSKKTINRKETYRLDGSGQIVICEACSNPILAEAGTKIDSGQILCSGCLRELRGHSLQSKM